MPLSAESLDRPLRDLAAPQQPAVTSLAPEPAHLREYLAVVLKRKWLILSLTVVVTSLVTIQMYRLPSIYEATTQIQIAQKTSNPLATGRGGVGVIEIRSSDPNYWNTQLQKLKTQKLARQVILRLDLQNNGSFLGTAQGTGVISGLRRLITREKPKPQAPIGSALPVVDESELSADTLTPEQAKMLEPYEDSLSANLNIEPIEKTNLVKIHFTHTDPQIAANVANTLAAIFRDNDIREETRGSQTAEDVLANQIIDLQARVQANMQKRLNYRRQNDLPLGNIQGQNLTALQLSTYSTQMQEAESTLRQAESDYQSALETRSNAGIWAVPQVKSDQNVIRLRQKISELKEQRKALLVVYTEEWPAVKKIDEQLAQLEKELKDAPEEVIAALKNRYEAARKNEAGARSRYFGSRSRANSQSVAEISLGDLDQAIETDRQNLNLYMQRLNELRVTNGDRTSGNVSTIEEARTPREPVGPQRVRNIFMALLLSLGVGVGLAFLLDYLDDTLKTVEDVDRYLHLPTLALIPAPREHRRLLERAAPPPDPAATNALALIEDVRSPVSEAYRHLRTSLLLSTAGQPPKTILVTSSQPSEGKTTTAVNIATMLAQTGADVLLIDCDLRRPRVHAHFGLPNSRGVTNYLSGDTNVEALIQTYDRVPNLKVISSGPVPPNAAELLGSDEMRKFLYTLSEQFTHVVIDSPPAISFTDASILSTMVDGVMLVVHGGRTSRAVARRARQQLQDVGAHLFGIVLNNVKLEGSNLYDYGAYYAGYYADDEEAADGAEVVGANGNGAR
ncbi:MAG TPA: polysaccharide biosynthesis tyrosine autokinase [Pyrinomonadaceae bacterium]|nr:polysaccharide biosynthesis tyrosine autokinase [Pyrinomonadaceae bacterium]